MRPNLVVGASILAGAVAAGAALAGGGAVGVTSSLEGTRVVPHRVKWVATVRPAATPVKVFSLIDGKVRWVETEAPYVYGDDSDWLVTSWLAAGRHRFTVRAVASNGTKAEASTVATIAALPRVPPSLAASRWQLALSKAQTGDAPAGTWTIQIRPAGWRIFDPAGGANFIDVAYVGSGVVETRGGIWTTPREAQEPNVQEGNGWCEDTNQPVRLRWTADRTSLRLAVAGANGCDGLGKFLSRTWKRVR
jgi:hypothetical protein